MLKQNLILQIKRPKIYSYLTDDEFLYNKAKGTERCGIKWEIKIEDYVNFLKVHRLKTIIIHLEKRH